MQLEFDVQGHICVLVVGRDGQDMESRTTAEPLDLADTFLYLQCAVESTYGRDAQRSVFG